MLIRVNQLRMDIRVPQVENNSANLIQVQDPWTLTSFLSQPILHKVPQADVLEIGVHVMLDDVKREVVESAEAPDTDG